MAVFPVLKMKRWFGQLRLVLKKNFTLRIRRPLLLTLEMFWPVLVFLGLVLLRYSTYQTKLEPCHFSTQALPSAGVLPFLQSFLCNTADSCLNESGQSSEWRHTKNSFAPRFEALVHDKNLSRVLRDLPYVVDGLVDGVAETERLSTLVRKAHLKEFVKDPNELKSYVVDEQEVLSSQVMDALLNSTFNFSQIFYMDTIDIQHVLCSPAHLGQYLVVHKDSEISLNETSAALCRISPPQLSDIGKKIAESLDLPKIIRTCAVLTHMLGDSNATEALEGVAEMWETVEKLSSLHKITEIFSLVWNVSHGVEDLWRKFALAASKSQTTRYQMRDWSRIARDTPLKSQFDIPTEYNMSRIAVNESSSTTQTDTDIADLLDAFQAILQSFIGPQNHMFWYQFQESLKQNTLLYRWIAKSVRKFQTEKITFGDKNISAAEEKHALCVDPGASNLFRFDPNLDKVKIREVQDAVCRLDVNVLTNQLLTTFEVHSLIDIYNPKSSGESDQFSLATMFEANNQMSNAIEITIQRWTPWLTGQYSNMGPTGPATVYMHMEQAKNYLTNSSSNLPEALHRSLTNSQETDDVFPVFYKILELSKSIAGGQMLNISALDSLTKDIDKLVRNEPVTMMIWEGVKIGILYSTGIANAMTASIERTMSLNGSIRLSDLYPEEELKKKASLLNEVPTFVEYIVSSSILYPTKYEKFLSDLQRRPALIKEICVDDHLFLTYFPPPSGLESNISSVQKIFCNGTYLDYESLSRQQQDLYPELYLAAFAVEKLLSSHPSQYSPVHINFYHVLNAFSKAMVTFSQPSRSESELSFAEEQVFSLETWTAIWDRIEKRLMSSTGSDSMAKLFQNLPKARGNTFRLMEHRVQNITVNHTGPPPGPDQIMLTIDQIVIQLNNMDELMKDLRDQYTPS